MLFFLAVWSSVSNFFQVRTFQVCDIMEMQYDFARLPRVRQVNRALGILKLQKSFLFYCPWPQLWFGIAQMFNKCLLNLMARFVYKINGAGEVVHPSTLMPMSWLPQPCSARVQQVLDGSACLAFFLQLQVTAGVATWASQSAWGLMKGVLWWRPLVRSEDGLSRCSMENTQRVL